MDDIESQIESDIKLLDAFSNSTHTVREKLIDKLEAVVDEMVLDPNLDKPMATDAKMNVINTLLKALGDAESSKIQLIKLKQKSKADQEQEDSLKLVSRTVAEFIKSIHNTGTINSTTSTDVTDKDAMLDKASEEASIEILAGELEMLGGSAQDIVLPV